MACSCIKGYYYPILESISNELLVYKDASRWQDPLATGTYPVKVHTLNSKINFSLNPDKDSITTITPTDLGLGDCCIEDDIYCFTATTCGEKFTVYRFISGNTQRAIDKLIIREDDRYKELEALMHRVRVSAERKDLILANKYFSLIQEILKNIDCDGC